MIAFNTFFKCVYLFLAVLGLHCSLWVFSSCSEWGLLSSCSTRDSYSSGCSCCGTKTLDMWTSVVVA